MSKRSLVIVLALAATALPAGAGPAAGGGAGDRVLAHNVYFALKDGSPAARSKLVEACRKYLTRHEGIVHFAAGTLAAEMSRPVNDRDYEVSLHIYFEDAAAHARYQEHPRHKQFIAEQEANWKKVRVFDSWVETSR